MIPTNRYCRMIDRLGTTVIAAVTWLAAQDTAVAADPPSQPAARGQAEKGGGALNSDKWRNTLAGLDQWLSIQTMYDDKEVERIKREVMRRVGTMSADELEQFRQNLDAKLVMLLSPEGRDILNWVAANLAAAAPAYRKKMDIQYPDVARLTPAQLREQLDLLEQKRTAAQGQTAALERSRQARIAGLQAQQRQDAQERQQALSRPPASASSPYHPSGMRQYPDVVSRPQYYGWGFGFW